MSHNTAVRKWNHELFGYLSTMDSSWEIISGPRTAIFHSILWMRGYEEKHICRMQCIQSNDLLLNFRKQLSTCIFFCSCAVYCCKYVCFTITFPLIWGSVFIPNKQHNESKHSLNIHLRQLPHISILSWNQLRHTYRYQKK